MTCLVLVTCPILNLHGLPHIFQVVDIQDRFWVARLVLLIRAFPGLLMRDEPVYLFVFIFVINGLLDAHIGT